MISRMFRGDDKNAAVKRKRQIDTLKIFNDNVVESREDAEYHVHFDAGDVRMAIIVILSSEFPVEKPVLKVSPAVIHHPWCNEHSEIVNAPGLVNFTVHSDLGRVVQVIIREFIKNPPLQSHEDTLPASNISNRSELLNGSPLCGSQCYPNLYSVEHHSSIFSSHSANICKYDYAHKSTLDDERVAKLNEQLMSNQAPIYTIVNFEFPELNCLSNEKLIELNEDDRENNRDAFLYQFSRLDEIHSSIDETIDRVEKMANENLSREIEIKTLQDEVISKMQSVSALKIRFDNLIQKYNKLSEAFAPDHIKECLKYAADDSHEQSEMIAESFLEGRIDAERFINTYIECRKLGQARRTKEEKLAYQLHEFKRAGY